MLSSERVRGTPKHLKHHKDRLHAFHQLTLVCVFSQQLSPSLKSLPTFHILYPPQINKHTKTFSFPANSTGKCSLISFTGTSHVNNYTIHMPVFWGTSYFFCFNHCCLLFCLRLLLFLIFLTFSCFSHVILKVFFVYTIFVVLLVHVNSSFSHEQSCPEAFYSVGTTEIAVLHFFLSIKKVSWKLSMPWLSSCYYSYYSGYKQTSPLQPLILLGLQFN